MNHEKQPPSKYDVTRIDESDDKDFYAKDRLVNHLDSRALLTVEELIGRLVVDEHPVILDLMASWDSHIPDTVRAREVIGLGLNEKELSRNGALTEYVVHDLNADPRLPFTDDRFDAVLCTVSVDYLTRPVEVFREVGRILKPGAMFLVIFSNRFFPSKAVNTWRQSSDEERLRIVSDFLLRTKMFGQPRVFVSKGQPRPSDDKYAQLGIPSDPIYAVSAEASSLNRAGRSVPVEEMTRRSVGQQEIDERKKRIRQTFRCPYCSDRLEKWSVPDSPFNEWPNDFFYVCFNDECDYFVRGWNEVASMGSLGSYRLMYDPLTDRCLPAPVFSSTTPRG